MGFRASDLNFRIGDLGFRSLGTFNYCPAANIGLWDTVVVVEAADASEVVAKALHRRPRRQ